MSLRRLSTSLRSPSFSSCLDSVDAIFESDAPGMIEDGDDGEAFQRDGGRVGAIFLGGNHLGDKGVERIVDGLEDKCREYYKLYLCHNRVGKIGASVVSNSLKHNTTLRELSLGNNHIGDEGARHLATALRDNCTLQMLNVENNNIGPAGVTALAKALEHNNDSLQWLVLSENPIGDEGANAILRCIGNMETFDHMYRCNHTLLSIILKKVSQVKDTTTLRKIQCYLKINRLSEQPMSFILPLGSFAQRKVLEHAKENPNALLEYFTAMQGDDCRKGLSLHPLILALLGYHDDLSTIYSILQNTPHLFSDDPDICRNHIWSALEC